MLVLALGRSEAAIRSPGAGISLAEHSFRWP